SPTVSTDAVRRDIALSLISPGTDSRRKTTLLSTTGWFYGCQVGNS
ncbi:Os04g0254300, partial [Oryza sativa Japonica Group]